MGKIRVLLADDHAILREGLRALLAYYPDVEVAGEAQDGAEAIRRVEELHPDVVVMDIAMPEKNGLEATREIRERWPETQVLILTQHEDRQYVLPLLQAGATGYVLKRALGADLITALRTVAQGQVFLYPLVAEMKAEMEQHPEQFSPFDSSHLTAREHEILEHIVSGETNPQIATALAISAKTVEWHRANLMAKLNAHTVADLVRRALQEGLVQRGV